METEKSISQPAGGLGHGHVGHRRTGRLQFRHQPPSRATSKPISGGAQESTTLFRAPTPAMFRIGSLSPITEEQEQARLSQARPITEEQERARHVMHEDPLSQPMAIMASPAAEISALDMQEPSTVFPSHVWQKLDGVCQKLDSWHQRMNNLEVKMCTLQSHVVEQLGEHSSLEQRSCRAFANYFVTALESKLNDISRESKETSDLVWHEKTGVDKRLTLLSDLDVLADANKFAREAAELLNAYAPAALVEQSEYHGDIDLALVEQHEDHADTDLQSKLKAPVEEHDVHADIDLESKLKAIACECTQMDDSRETDLVSKLKAINCECVEKDDSSHAAAGQLIDLESKLKAINCESAENAESSLAATGGKDKYSRGFPLLADLEEITDACNSAGKAEQLLHPHPTVQQLEPNEAKLQAKLQEALEWSDFHSNCEFLEFDHANEEDVAVEGARLLFPTQATI